MKSLIQKIFKREPTLNYIIAEYKPQSSFVPKAPEMTEYEFEARKDSDEMEIDNIYQKS